MTRQKKQRKENGEEKSGECVRKKMAKSTNDNELS